MTTPVKEKYQTMNGDRVRSLEKVETSLPHNINPVVYYQGEVFDRNYGWKPHLWNDKMRDYDNPKMDLIAEQKKSEPIAQLQLFH